MTKKTDIQENTLYKDATEKADLLKSPQKVATLFWINTLGFLAIYKNYGKTGKFKAYLRGVDKTRIDSIDDTSHDMASALKLANEAKLLTPSFTMEFTKLLYILKTKPDVQLDETQLRNLFGKLIFDRIRPDARIANDIKEWLDSTKTLDEIVFPLFYVAKYTKSSEDFQTYTKYFYKDFARRAIELSQKARGIAPTFTPKGYTSTVSQTASVMTLGAGTTNKATTAPVTPPTPVVPVVVKQKTQAEIDKDNINNFDLSKNFKSGPNSFSTELLVSARIIAELFVHYRNWKSVNDYVFAALGKNEFKSVANPDLWRAVLDALNGSGDNSITTSGTGTKNIGINLSNVNLRSDATLLNEIYKFISVINMKGAYNEAMRVSIERRFEAMSLLTLNTIPTFYSDIHSELQISRYEVIARMRAGRPITDWGYPYRAILVDNRDGGNIFFNRIKDEILRGVDAWKRDKTYSVLGDFLANANNTLREDDFKELLKKLKEVYPGIDTAYPVLFDKIAKPSAIKIIETCLDALSYSHDATVKYSRFTTTYGSLENAIQNGDVSEHELFNLLVNYNKPLKLVDYLFFKSFANKLWLKRNDDKDVVFEAGTGIFVHELVTNALTDAEFVEIYSHPKAGVVSYYHHTKGFCIRYVRLLPWPFVSFNRYTTYFKEFYEAIRDKGFDKAFKFTDRTDMPWETVIVVCQRYASDPVKMLTNHNYNWLKKTYPANVESPDTVLRESWFEDSKTYMEYLSQFDSMIDATSIQKLPRLAKRVTYDGLKKILARVNNPLDGGDVVDRIEVKNTILSDLVYNASSVDQKNNIINLTFEGIVSYKDWGPQFGKDITSKISKFSHVPEFYCNVAKAASETFNFTNDLYWGTYKSYVESLDVIEVFRQIDADTTMPESKKRDLVNKIVESFKMDKKLKKDRKEYLISQFIGGHAVKSALDDVSKNSLIPLQKAVTDNDVKNILKFNNFSITLPASARYRENNRQGLTPYDWIKKNENVKIDLPKLAVSKVDYKDDDLEKMTVEYTKFYNNNHGDTGAEFLEAFDVNLESDEFKEFIKQNPTPTVIPAFHGTGSVAASMILRFGFKIITRPVGGVTVTGKMLGNGVYFSNIISKAIQYLGDDGYNRRPGTIGYLFELEAYIGKDGTDYSAAGIGRDSIRSPEWCVFNPRAQLKITKAYKVKMVKGYRIDELKKKYPEALKEDVYFKAPSFKSFLKEEKENKGVITFIFSDGLVPSGETAVDFDKYNLKPGMELSYSQMGPEISFMNTEESMTIMVPNTYEMVTQDPEGIFTLWKSLVDKY